MTEVVLFYYTLAVMLAAIMTAAFCLAAYLVSRRHLFAYAGASFLAYFFDVALVFQDDFLLRGGGGEYIESIYFVGSQLPSIVTGAGVLGAFWLLVCDWFEVKGKGMKYAPIVAFVIGSAVLYFALDSSSFGLFVFYGMRSVFIAWILCFVGWRYLGANDSGMRGRLWRFRYLYAGMWLLLFAVVAENVVFMFVVDPQLVAEGMLPFFPERNFAENAFMVMCAAVVSVVAAHMLSLHFNEPPANDGEKVAAFIENGMATYKERYGLSARETEVLREVLSGKDNQHIANDMNLALSTVKVHVHNILQKTGQANRQELMQDFRMKS